MTKRIAIAVLRTYSSVLRRRGRKSRCLRPRMGRQVTTLAFRSPFLAITPLLGHLKTTMESHLAVAHMRSSVPGRRGRNNKSSRPQTRQVTFLVFQSPCLEATLLLAHMQISLMMLPPPLVPPTCLQ